MSEKLKSINLSSILNSVLLVVVLGVLKWAGTTLQDVQRKIDILEVQFTDYKANSEDKWATQKAATARCDAMLAQISAEFPRLRRSAPPKQNQP